MRIEIDEFRYKENTIIMIDTLEVCDIKRGKDIIYSQLFLNWCF